jgi:putative phosphotransacetylase
MKVTVGISNRHVHLTKEDLEVLFGEGYELEVVRPINQPGQFASNSFVTIKTEKSEIEHVRVLGPIRPYTQIEISMTEARKLGVNPPVRTSGDLEGSSPVTLIGPKGELHLDKGLIIADRHIHMTPKQKEMYGFKDVDKVSVAIPGEKGGIINNVHLKVTEEAYYEMHLDTDDANAHLLHDGDIVEII